MTMQHSRHQNETKIQSKCVLNPLFCPTWFFTKQLLSQGQFDQLHTQIFCMTLYDSKGHLQTNNQFFLRLFSKLLFRAFIHEILRIMPILPCNIGNDQIDTIFRKIRLQTTEKSMLKAIKTQVKQQNGHVLTAFKTEFSAV